MGCLEKPQNISSMYTLKICNIPFTTNELLLRKKFSKYGTIGDVFLPREHGKHRNRGFAFVRYLNEHDAKRAIRHADQSMFEGRQLQVQMAKYGPPLFSPINNGDQNKFDSEYYHCYESDSDSLDEDNSYSLDKNFYAKYKPSSYRPSSNITHYTAADDSNFEHSLPYSETDDMAFYHQNNCSVNHYSYPENRYCEKLGIKKYEGERRTKYNRISPYTGHERTSLRQPNEFKKLYFQHDSNPPPTYYKHYSLDNKQQHTNNCCRNKTADFYTKHYYESNIKNKNNDYNYNYRPVDNAIEPYRPSYNHYQL